ncbi:hypothetical protein ZWY2020_016406 [Hordeum vulgare]|nr:hypothetical protein ZWY2020_016406 [Hordeum vulgare]
MSIASSSVPRLAFVGFLLMLCGGVDGARFMRMALSSIAPPPPTGRTVLMGSNPLPPAGPSDRHNGAAAARAKSKWRAAPADLPGTTLISSGAPPPPSGRRVLKSSAPLPPAGPSDRHN